MKSLLRYITFILCTVVLINNSYSITQVTAMVDFNSERYLGTWYEIARIPLFFERKCIAPITANYSLDSKEISVKNKCLTKSGKFIEATGVARFTKSPKIAELKVSFLPKWIRWTKIGTGDYLVLYTDYDNYALVGSPNHKYLWILARTEKVDIYKINQLLDIAKEQGFDNSKLLFNY